MGEDLSLMTKTCIGEVTLPSAEASSTMPQKQNPVMVAIGRQIVGLDCVMQTAAIHR